VASWPVVRAGARSSQRNEERVGAADLLLKKAA
jgi:hypothetical protein